MLNGGGMPQNMSWAGVVQQGLRNRSISLKDANRNGAEIPGLSTFNPFSNENAFQVDTNTCLGSKYLPGISAPFL